MKKITIAIFMMLSTFSIASAELGINVGVSGNIGVYDAAGFEMDGTEKTIAKREEALAAMASVFIEKKLTFLPGFLGNLSVGYDHVTHDLKTSTQSRTEIDLKGKIAVNDTYAQSSEITNKVSATLSNINTVYALFNVTDWLYVKAGVQEMDVKSTESLGTGSAYSDTAIDGTIMAAGLQGTTDSGMFYRIEYETVDLDGAKLISTTNADNSVTLDDIGGESARISIGKTF